MKQDLLKKLNIQCPYSTFTIDESIKDFGGWNSNSPNFQLAKNKTVCLEIGSWMGGSAKTLCGVIPDNGVLICCDNFLGSHEHFIDKTIPLNAYGKSMLYEYFLTNTFQQKDKIIPMMLSSSSAAEVFRRKGITFDFIYIDGDHREDAVYNDIKESFSLLNPGGIILGDDYSWGTVRNGLEKFGNDFRVDYTTNNSQYIIRK